MRDEIEKAVALNIPVLHGVVDRKHMRVWCDGCFAWHWHGGPGMKVPHCPHSARWYLVIPSGLDPDVSYAYKAATRWKTACPRAGCRMHLRPTLGPGSRPHYLNVVARPGPGSPSFCVVTGRFFNLITGEQAAPAYTEDELIRYRYVLDHDALSARRVANR